jgi:hypothetical protein
MNYAIKNVQGQWIGKSTHDFRRTPSWVSRPYDVIARLISLAGTRWGWIQTVFNIDEYVVVTLDVDTFSLITVAARQFVREHYKPSWTSQWLNLHLVKGWI